jgi:uncharacterized protein YjeT (DUF2065 family)
MAAALATNAAHFPTLPTAVNFLAPIATLSFLLAGAWRAKSLNELEQNLKLAGLISVGVQFIIVYWVGVVNRTED